MIHFATFVCSWCSLISLGLQSMKWCDVVCPYSANIYFLKMTKKVFHFSFLNLYQSSINIPAIYKLHVYINILMSERLFTAREATLYVFAALTIGVNFTWKECANSFLLDYSPLPKGLGKVCCHKIGYYGQSIQINSLDNDRFTV